MTPRLETLLEKPNPVTECLQALKEGTASPKTLSRMARALEIHEEVIQWEKEEDA